MIDFADLLEKKLLLTLSSTKAMNKFSYRRKKKIAREKKWRKRHGSIQIGGHCEMEKGRLSAAFQETKTTALWLELRLPLLFQSFRKNFSG